MNAIKLKTLVRVKSVKSKGRRTGRSKGELGIISETKQIMTNAGEATYYQVFVINNNNTITLHPSQFEVLGPLEDYPEIFI